MITSILRSTKKYLGIDHLYTAFDEDILMQINSCFATLHQLGVGPEQPFSIQDETAVWDDFQTKPSQQSWAIKYVWLKTRITFDPPSTANLVEAFKEEINQLEWRLNVSE